MCEIQPKKFQKFVVEWFTTHDISLDSWNEHVAGNMLAFEKIQNERGDYRVHVHTLNEAGDMVEELHTKFMAQAKDYMHFAEKADENDKEVFIAKAKTLLWVMELMVNYLKDNPSAKM